MVPELLARVDGLPVRLLERERVFPAPDATNGSPSSRQRARAARRRIERQTAVVHECRLPAWARALIAEQAAEQERLEIRG
jgi:hypothetical protein